MTFESLGLFKTGIFKLFTFIDMCQKECVEVTLARNDLKPLPQTVVEMNSKVNSNENASVFTKNASIKVIRFSLSYWISKFAVIL